MTEKTIDPDLLEEITTRTALALVCPDAAANGRQDMNHTWRWITRAYTDERVNEECALCGYVRESGESAENTSALLDEIHRLKTENDALENDKKHFAAASNFVLTKKQVSDWLEKQALVYRSTRSVQHGAVADSIDFLAGKVAQGAVTEEM